MKSSITIPDIHLFFYQETWGIQAWFSIGIMYSINILSFLLYWYQKADEVSCLTRWSHACGRNRCWTTVLFIAKVVCYPVFMEKKSLKAGQMITLSWSGGRNTSCRPVESSSCSSMRHFTQCHLYCNLD